MPKTPKKPTQAHGGDSGGLSRPLASDIRAESASIAIIGQELIAHCRHLARLCEQRGEPVPTMPAELAIRDLQFMIQTFKADKADKASTPQQKDKHVSTSDSRLGTW